MNTYEVPFSKYKAHLLIFLTGNDTITLRTFTDLNPENEPEGVYTEASPEDVLDVLNLPGAINRMDYSGKYVNTKFKGSDIFPDFNSEGNITLLNSYTFKLDSEWFGTGGIGDRSTILFTCDGNGFFRAPFNVAAYTYLTKQHRHALYSREQVNSFFMIIKPYADSSLQECTLFVKWNKDSGYKVRHPFNVIGTRIEGQPSEKIFTRIKIEGPESITANSSPVIFNLKVVHPITGEVDTNCNSTVYIEPVSGYVPHTRVKMFNGEGSFRAIPLYMEAGEEFRIKVGWKLWTGEDEYITTLI